MEMVNTVLQFMPGRYRFPWAIGAGISVFSVLLTVFGCGQRQNIRQPLAKKLILMGLSESPAESGFYREQLAKLEGKAGLNVGILAGYNSEETRLGVLQQFLKEKSPQPDIFLIDNIWPGLLADDLMDLRPYLSREELGAFDPKLLDAFTVQGKLLALPAYIDFGILYYRTDLLKKYGYAGPPRTWDELAAMAWTIQAGERRAGNADFWGYAWEGVESESLTCNGLEWEVAEGGSWIKPDGKVDAAGEASQRALARAAKWVGTISPPSVVEYDEEDALNLWIAGKAAFLRNWIEVVPMSEKAPGTAGKFAITVLPAGSHGRSWTFGGMGFSVSKYSKWPREAAEVVRFLVSEQVQRERVTKVGLVPTHSRLLGDPRLMAETPLGREVGERWQGGLTLRPATLVGKNYTKVSAAYSAALHRILAERAVAGGTLQDLQRETMRLTGLRETQPDTIPQ